MRRAFDVCDPKQGHQVANMVFQQYIKPETQKGARGRLIWEPLDTAYRHQLRKLFHGPLLTDFSEQVWLIDPVTDARVRYVPSVWKRHLKDLFCQTHFDAAGNELPKSTEALNDEDFADFILACQAYGVIDCGIAFTDLDNPGDDHD